MRLSRVNRNGKRNHRTACVANAKRLNHRIRIIVGFAIDVSRVWTIIVRG